MKRKRLNGKTTDVPNHKLPRRTPITPRQARAKLAGLFAALLKGDIVPYVVQTAVAVLRADSAIREASDVEKRIEALERLVKEKNAR